MNIQDELINIRIFLTNITDTLELYTKRRDYHNRLLNGFAIIESGFNEETIYNFYNDKDVRKRVYEYIEKLYEVLDSILEDREFKALEEDILILKYSLVDFEKKIKSLI